MSNINIIEVRKIIREKHSNFIGRYGSIVERVLAEHNLKLQMVKARLDAVTDCFVKEGIIDKVEDVNHGSGDTICFILFRGGAIGKRLAIITDGEDVKIRTLNNSSFTSLKDNLTSEISENSEHSNVLSEDFNWNSFSLDLLNIIHKTMYEKKDASQAVFDGIFKDK